MVDEIIMHMAEKENSADNRVMSEKAVLSSNATVSEHLDELIDKNAMNSGGKQSIAGMSVGETEQSNKCIEPIDWNTLKQSGMSELGAVGQSTKRVIPRSDLLSHVPSETTVVKYGYIENRVLDILENIIETSGVLSRRTLESISIEDMKLTEDGRDINIRFRINNASRRFSKQGSYIQRGRNDFDDDSLFDDLCIV